MCIYFSYYDSIYKQPTNQPIQFMRKSPKHTPSIFYFFTAKSTLHKHYNIYSNSPVIFSVSPHALSAVFTGNAASSSSSLLYFALAVVVGCHSISISLRAYEK